MTTIGIAPTLEPSEQFSDQNDNNAPNNKTTVESPISDGVEKMQSATGVTTTIPNNSHWSSLLNPQQSSSTTTWHTVTLDGRALRTPLNLPLTLPSLTLVVASEWDAQKIYLQPAQILGLDFC